MKRFNVVLAGLLLALAGLAQAQTEPAHGGTLVVAVSIDPGHLNPGISTAGPVHAVAGLLYNGLVGLDDNANPYPDLAERWEVSEDATSYTFYLAQGVRWHDGEPFTSADVKFTFEEVLLNFHARTKAGLEGLLESIETPDEHTVVFSFKEPYAPLLQRLNVTEAPILPRHIYAEVEDIQTAPANLNPIGTGPFKLEAYLLDDRITMVRNEDYFKPGLPYLDAVVFRVIPDQSTQLLALERGEIDFIRGVPGPELERIEADPTIDIHRVSSSSGGGFCVMTMAFNSEREIFQDLRVRQAMAHAINREQLLEQAIFGQGRVATGPISSRMAFAYTDDVKRYPYDVETANALLDEAGLLRGEGGIRFTMNFVHFPTFSKYGEILRENLSAVGINVELMPLDPSAFVTRVFTNRDFDTNVISYCNNSDPTIGVSRVYVSTNIGDIPFSNAAAYRNPVVDELFARGAREADQAVRGEIYAEIQRVLVEELPYWWLVETDFTAASGASVHGLAPWSGQFAEAAWFEEGGN